VKELFVKNENALKVTGKIAEIQNLNVFILN